MSSAARKDRLASAKIWLAGFTFDDDFHIVKAYRKHFNVDARCAMTELCMLKVLSPKKQALYEKQIQDWRKKKSKPTEPKAPDTNLDSDATFAFIAGYTPSGAPYGITWEEAERMQIREENSLFSDEEEYDLPF